MWISHQAYPTTLTLQNMLEQKNVINGSIQMRLREASASAEDKLHVLQTLVVSNQLHLSDVLSAHEPAHDFMKAIGEKVTMLLMSYYKVKNILMPGKA